MRRKMVQIPISKYTSSAHSNFVLARINYVYTKSTKIFILVQQIGKLENPKPNRLEIRRGITWAVITVNVYQLQKIKTN